MIKLLRTSLTVIVVLLILIILISFAFEKTYSYPSHIKYGVTFSPNYARYLKLDWQKTYIQILDELRVKNLRLPSYWTSLEPDEMEYDFADTDFMLNEASKRGIGIILVLGARQPRWPECHIPVWAKRLNLQQRQQAALKFTKQVVERYKSNSSIWAWQVENEPFLSQFGENCDILDINFLKSELEMVSKLDNRPIILTDSGELGGWEAEIKLTDIFGISVYRTVYNPFLGYQNYPILPAFYYLKSYFYKSFLAKPEQKTIIVELQTEPWLSDKDARENLPSRHNQLFSLANFKSNIEFAKKTGFDEAYLWGVEWWYWMAKNGYPQYLEHAKTLF